MLCTVYCVTGGVVAEQVVHLTIVEFKSYLGKAA